MAQIIKHRRGSLEGLAAVTASINKGELVIASGSSNLSVSNGSSIVFAAAENGQLQAVNRILVGTSAPNTFSNATYNGLLNGVPYYDSTSGSLYILGSDGNTKLNLIGNINEFSISVDSRLDTIESSLGGGGSIGSRVSSLESFSSSQESKNLTLATYTGSVEGRFSTLATLTGSIASEQTTQNNRLSAIESFTGSYATTGSNVFYGNQIITGSVYINANLIVQGSSSIQYISASSVEIGTNTIKLSTASPAVRFGGIDVYDSGSQNATGSLYWDSLKNHWISVRPSSSTEVANSAALIYGPKHTGSIGNEGLLTAGKIPVAEGEDHITDSIMTQSGNKITLSGSLDVLNEISASTINGLGNVSAFSQSLDSRLDSIESSIGGGATGIGARVATLESFTGSYATTGSNTFIGNEIVSGNIVLANNGQIRVESNTADTLFGMFDGNNILGAYYQMWGNNHPTSDLTQRGSAEFVFDTRNGGGEFRIVEFDGSTWKKRFVVDRSGNTQVTGSLFVSGAISGSTLTGIGNVTAYSTSVDARLSSLQITSGALNTFSASANTRFTEIGVVSGSLIASASNAASRLTTLEGTGTIQGLGTGNNVTFAKVTTTGDVVVGGDLVVQGNTVSLNASTLVVEDKLITLASGSTSSATADGAGFEVAGTSAQFVYQHSTTAFTSSIAVIAPEVTASLNVPGYGSSKRMAFRAATGNLDFVAAPSNAGDLVQWNGTDFVMSNVIDGGTF